MLEWVKRCVQNGVYLVKVTDIENINEYEKQLQNCSQILEAKERKLLEKLNERNRSVWEERIAM